MTILTLEEDYAFLATFHLDCLICSLVAFQLEGGGTLVAYKALLTLQH
jgi:hypothetical protein